MTGHGQPRDVGRIHATATPAHPRLLATARRFAQHLAATLQADFALRLWDGSTIPLGPAGHDDLAIVVRSPTALIRLLRRPRLATLVDLLAEGSLDIQGGTLLDLAARRGTASRGLFKRLSKWQLVRTAIPFLLASTRTKDPASLAYTGDADTTARRDDKALVQFHYDLSNAFYVLFLDPQMQYSCAYFPTSDTGIADAQQANIERLGLRDRVTIELKDYRQLEGEFDRIASIGMFEHVPWDDHAAYVQKMRSLLRPQGVMLHHAITRPAKGTLKAFRRKRAEYAAIVNFIFPGSGLDHVGHTIATLEANGFEVHDVEAWREHYARTARLWCERLHANRAAAEQEVGAAKTRLWLLYLAGVSLGFDRGGIGIFQTVATRRARGRICTNNLDNCLNNNAGRL